MNIDTRIVHGDIVDQNPLPPRCKDYQVKLNGEYKGNPESFYIDESTLSKHTLLIGGTGCGKTTLFFHFVKQIKKRMTKDDVMIIFDSKGDFYSKFGQPTDLIIGNSKQYISKSQKWNIFKEILADGMDEKNYIFNIQEICNSFFAERIKKTTKSKKQN